MEGVIPTTSSPSFFFLLVLLACFSLTACSASRALPRSEATEFIRTSCAATTYPAVCFNSLSTYTSTIQTSPRLMAQTALSVTLASAHATSGEISRMSSVPAPGMKPRYSGAMKDCVENLADSVDELRRSMAEMTHLSGPNFDLKMNDIQTWVSAALTDEDTCMDGFDGAQRNVKATMRGKIVKVAQLTSNALALINGLAAASHP